MENKTGIVDLVLSLGSNLGEREEMLEQAITMLQSKFDHPSIISGIYESDPWGKENQPKFLNIAIVFKTKISPIDCLNITQKIEDQLGRKRDPDSKWDARTIDIDILFYGRELIESPTLLIPHPLLTDRKFVLMPLKEIIPSFEHPKNKLTINELYKGCSDKGRVERLNSFIFRQ